MEYTVGGDIVSFTRALFGLTAVAALCISSLNSPVTAQQKKETGGKEPKYQKIVPKVVKFSQLAETKGYRELTEAPKDFPIPVYQGRFAGGSERTSDLGKTSSVQIVAPDNVERVIDWYRSALKGAGWRLQESIPTGAGAANITGYKTGMLCRVGLRGTASQTDITLSVTKKM